MIVSIWFLGLFFFNQHHTVLETQIFNHLVLRNKETLKLIQEMRGSCKAACDRGLESCQERKAALEVCFFLMVSYFSSVHLFICSFLCSLLSVSMLYLFCFFISLFCPQSYLLRHWHNFMASFSHWVILHAGSNFLELWCLI